MASIKANKLSSKNQNNTYAYSDIDRHIDSQEWGQELAEEEMEAIAGGSFFSDVLTAFFGETSYAPVPPLYLPVGLVRGYEY